MMTFLRRRRRVAARLVGVGEEAGGLDDDVDAEVPPGDVAGVAFGEDLDRLAVDLDGAVVALMAPWKGP